MIDISNKEPVTRIAKASGKITLRNTTIEKIKNKTLKKGDVLTIAKIAAINAVKKVPDLIPLCHPIPITNVKVDFNIEDDTTIKVSCLVKSVAQTGVEMEALTGVTVALLNILDMIKMYEKNEEGQYPFTVIYDIKVDEKIKEYK
ncbi:MAG: cyclic pyranopterin monophosphate synthase MoaC [Candidatus Lokiarchaeota archaeon]|nr:cyclic pyranopterin monophosphate synthase MoaC [Candidatus Lokiarchaeota archaeon]